MPLQSLARQLPQRGRHAHPLLARRFRENAVPFGESGPEGRKGKLQAREETAGERWLEYAKEDGLHRAGSSARADAPSVVGATASPEGTPRTSVACATVPEECCPLWGKWPAGPKGEVADNVVEDG